MTLVLLVPTMINMVLNHPSAGKYDLSSLKRLTYGASPMPVELLKQGLSKWGQVFSQGYGLTEAAPLLTGLDTWDHQPDGSPAQARRLASVGREVLGVEVRVVNDDGKDVQPGEIGEIALRPKRPDAFMLGYHGKDAATLQATRNLWFHSGDRGHLSPEGYLYFEERMKDSIRRRGENIAAWEVESVLEQHPQVAEAAVYGLPCGDDDEEVAVSLVPADDAFDLTSLCAFARANLPAYAVPTLLRLAKDLPRTPTAKVKKDELRALPRDAYSPVPAHGPAWPAPARDEA